MTPGSQDAMLGLAVALVLLNAAYIYHRAPLLRARYPAASLPPRLPLVWGTLIAGVIALFAGQLLTPHAGALLQPAWGAAVPAAGTAIATLGWIALLVDARSRKLPSELTWLMGAEVAAAWLICWVATGFSVPGLLGPLSAASLWVVPIYLGSLRGGVGQGDVRLSLVLGFALGTMSLAAAVLGMVVAFLGSGLAALSLLQRGAGSRTRFALGPFLLAGAWTAWGAGAVIPLLV